MLTYTFLARLYNYDDERLESVVDLLELQRRHRTLRDLHLLFYRRFEHGFCGGGREVTINVHTFLHLAESRRRTGPLHRNSTEAFEANYAVLRRCFQTGTRNTGKQALQNYYLRFR